MSKDVWDLSDDELEVAFQAAKAEMGSPDTAYEEEREEEIEHEDLEQPVHAPEYGSLRSPRTVSSPFSVASPLIWAPLAC